MANKDTLNAFFQSSANTDLNVKIAKSMGWLQSTLAKVLSMKKAAGGVKVGKMYTFAYEPLGSDRLPYWDRFPLVVVLEIRKETIIGLNVHYIPMKDRIKVFKTLIANASTSGLNARSEMTRALDDIKKIKNSEYMIKQYHHQGLRSNIFEIPGNEWGQAVTLPYANWKTGDGSQNRMGPVSRAALVETKAIAKTLINESTRSIKT
jgi:hypothetical protein